MSEGEAMKDWSSVAVEIAADAQRLREAAQRVLDARTKPYDEYIAAMEGLKEALDG